MQLSILNTIDVPKDAIFSPCRQYRYLLWRRWGEDWEANFAMFIGLNPSTADETKDDPTIRRCIAFAKSWGHSALLMANIFAYRATDPNVMKQQPDPIGADNDRYLLEYANKANVVIAAWGNHGTHNDRQAKVKALIPNLHCLKITAAGMPGHPLYLPQTLKPIKFS